MALTLRVALRVLLHQLIQVLGEELVTLILLLGVGLMTQDLGLEGGLQVV